MPKCPCLRPEEPEVHVLDYRHCSLEHMPPDVFLCERTLEELYVDSNQIRDLPRELFYCHGLRKLCVSDNEITSVPPAIASLIHLEHLDISKNGIVDLPDSIKCCKYLANIEASVNPLGKLPEGFTQLLNLSELYLNDTFLDYLPGSFGRLTKLRILEVRENHLKTLPKSLGRLTLLERLDIGNNEFTEVPEVVGSLTSLLELWCDSNQICTLPATIGQLKQLMFMDASKNRIEVLPNEIDGCINLGDLHLSTNLLTQLPENIGRLSNLTTLKIDDNRLTSLPFSIGGLVSLSELNLSANDLEEIPPSIGFLRHLRTMYCDENFLYDIPAELGSCSGITVMSFRSNNLMYIPDEVGRIPRLRVLNLSDNKIRFLPYSLTRLKELQALWLSENQTKPLIRLQPDIDIDTGQRMLTCYLLPQQTSDDNDDMYSEHGSFHPSMWEEERKNKQRIHFDFDTVEEPGKLERHPTPYPKEMKNRVQHMRNLALKQLNVPNIPNGAAVREGPDPGGGAKHGGGVDGPMREGKPVSPLLAERRHLLRADKEKNTKDKLKIMQHRMSQESIEKSAKDAKQLSIDRNSTNGREEDTEGGFRGTAQPQQTGPPTPKITHLGHPPPPPPTAPSPQHPQRTPTTPTSNPQHPQRTPTTPTSNPHPQRTPTTPTSKQRPTSHLPHPTITSSAGSTANLGMPGAVSSPQTASITGSVGSLTRPPTGRPPVELRVRSHPAGHYPHYYPRPSGHHRRARGYESDTGYRSDTVSEMGYRSDSAYRPHQGGSRTDGYASDFEVMRGARGRQQRGRDGGYTSDIEGYVGRRVEYPNIYRPLSGHAPRHPGGRSDTKDSPQPVAEGNRGTSSGAGQKSQGYSNAPYFRRTKIQNDELYEQQCAPPMPSRPQLYPPSQSTSLHSLPGAPAASPARSSQQCVDELTKGTADQEDEMWKAQLYKASVKLQKTPSDKRKRIQKPVIEKHNDSNDSVFLQPPPYQPAPPYPTSKVLKDTISDPPQSGPPIDIPIMASSPKSARARRSDPSCHALHSISATARRPEMDNLQRPVGYGVSQSDVTASSMESPAGRPTSLPLATDGGPPAPRSGHIPDGRSQTASTQSPRTPRARHGGGSQGSHTVVSEFSQGVTSANTTLDTSLQMTQYEKDVAVFKQLEPPSQVSSSTDSGYGHHIYDRGSTNDGGPQLSPSLRGQSPPSPHLGTPRTPALGGGVVPCFSPSRDSGAFSRETTPGTPGTSGGYRQNGTEMMHIPNDTRQLDTSPRKLEVFRVTISKNPGLGFSIAGGIGSPGNPFVPHDQGIFITKVQDQGPACEYLQRGDKILEVDGIDFTDIEHSEAVGVLRTSDQTVALYVERSESVMAPNTQTL